MKISILSHSPIYSGILSSMDRCRGKTPSVEEYSSDMTPSLRKRIKDNAISKKHYSLLEKVWFHIDFSDVSRLCVDQFRTHRHLSFHVESQGQKFPSSLVKPPNLTPEQSMTWDHVWVDINKMYSHLVTIGIPPANARRIIPIGAESSCSVSGNARSWYEFIQKRLCIHCDWEIRILAEETRKLLASKFPELFEKMSCPGCIENCFGTLTS